MPKLTKSVEIETAFNRYVIDEQIGEGGAGRVFGGRDESGVSVALKLLSRDSADKRKRFKNEIAFLSKNLHQNLVSVIDHGFATTQRISGPFYVMPRFPESLRAPITRKIAPPEVMPIFRQILDGVEAAHLLNVTHRDLKPENVLYDPKQNRAAIADFGIASFTQDQLRTLVETQPAQRLANFQYAAPEQRMPGKTVGVQSDIYALGLILNEMFTAELAHGNDYRTISSSSPEFGYLDPIVAKMLQSDPSQRPGSIREVKSLIQKYQAEMVSQQKISQISSSVIPEGEIDDPLALKPPEITAVEWKDGLLIITLDQPVSPGWIDGLHNMGSYQALMHVPPERYSFAGNTARVQVDGPSAQSAIDHFKGWLPKATSVFRYKLEAALKGQQQSRLQELQRQRAAEETNLSVNRSLKF